MRTIPDPGFAGDDGSAPAALREALTTFATDPAHPVLPVLDALQDARLLVPVVAVLGEVEYDDAGARPRQDLRHGDGPDAGSGRPDGPARLHRHRRAGRWNPEGRPVPVSARDAAKAALHDGAEALLVDVAGPMMFVVEGEDLRALADGATLVDLAGRHAWVLPEGPARPG